VSLPRNKAPGIDSITSEVLRPIHDRLSKLLYHLFLLCWSSGLTPLSWCTAQVIPIHKKNDPADFANYRPISLTTTFHKIMERCLQQLLTNMSPPLDIAPGDFRPERSTHVNIVALLLRPKYYASLDTFL
jgi:hypothetical protein